MMLDAHLVVQPSTAFRLDARLLIEAGETVALLGPNGAGKTTALSALAGIVALDAGHVRLGDRPLDDPAKGIFVPPEDRRVGVVFQDYVLFPHMTAAENIAFSLRSRGVPRAAARAVAAEWLDRLGLHAFASFQPAQLSGGQSQQIAIARTLASEPAALLLDEPLAALDVTTRAELRRALAAHLSGFPGPRLLVTHDPTEAFLLADRVIVLQHGEVAQEGTPAELRQHPGTPYVADLVGVNLLTGTAMHGEVRTGDAPPIHIADTTISGDVLLSIHPRAISLHTEEPRGSPRNTWRTVIGAIEPLGDRIRVQLGPPHAFTAELTEAARTALHLEPGAEVWVALKATEINVKNA